MNFQLLFALLAVVDDASRGRGTSGQWEFRDPTCTEAPVLCATPAEAVR